MKKRIILEGTDLIGKTTIAKELKKLKIPVKDRSKHISNYIKIGEDNIERIKKSIIKFHKNDLVVILIVKNEEILKIRKMHTKELDFYDKNSEEYNRIYNVVSKKIKLDNVKTIVIDKLSLADKVEMIIKILKEQNK